MVRLLRYARNDNEVVKKHERKYTVFSGVRE